jgi:hypothetical protein
LLLVVIPCETIERRIIDLSEGESRTRPEKSETAGGQSYSLLPA